jgi:hypothetical protein
MSVKEKEDVLKEIKDAEKKIKAKKLSLAIERIKETAHKILEMKTFCVMMLEEVGISEEDQKRVIDFVNELPGTKLQEEDKMMLRQEARREILRVEKPSQSGYGGQSAGGAGYKTGETYSGAKLNRGLTGSNYATTVSDSTFMVSATGGSDLSIKL